MNKQNYASFIPPDTKFIDTESKTMHLLTYVLSRDEKSLDNMPLATMSFEKYKYFRSADFRSIFDILEPKFVDNNFTQYVIESNKIAIGNMRGAGNIFVCSLNTSYKLDSPIHATCYKLPAMMLMLLLKYPKIDKFVSEKIDKIRISMGKTYRPIDRYTIIIDDSIPDDILLIGYSGDKGFDMPIKLLDNEFIYVEEFISKYWTKLKLNH